MGPGKNPEGPNRGQKIEPKHFFLKLFGRFRDIPAKSRDIPPKKFDSLGFGGHKELFGPHPFTWKTPTPPENIRAQKFRFGFLFRAWPKIEKIQDLPSGLKFSIDQSQIESFKRD